MAGREIYKNTRAVTSNFGRIPEYIGRAPLSQEHCETCRIKDFVLCIDELIKCGDHSHWDDLNRFARNQLTENQVKYTGYNRNLDKCLIGAGEAETDSISLCRAVSMCAFIKEIRP